ncbi:MAG: D-alanine--D-alanine ligase [Chloroflexi bacterium]|nr:D-alanine--D-alanine ligase [Chloroflexota bacterium]MBP8054868.1 D-alanine--D-alanine ligase [Chloroflexota bacterium]
MSQSKHKIRVGIIFGGRSGEHEVSLNSARSVMKALDPEKYEVVQIGITHEGQWLTGEAMQALTAGYQAGENGRMALVQAGTSETQISQLTASNAIDVVFPVLHGTYGEDGTVQGLLELAGVPYIGAGVVGSAVGMDKAIFKQVMTANQIPVLPWLLVLKSQWQARPQTILDLIEARLRYPVFTKPANLGSSVGISKCRDRAELATGLDEAARFDRRIVIEQGINARELEVSVLGNDDPIASIVGEVRPRRDFYDYVAKYVSDDSELLIPAPLTPELAANVRRMAVQAYQAIDCAGLGRVDMLLDKDSDAVYLNEINTIPGFTQISMYPKLWEATGLSYPELLDRLVQLALERFAEKDQLTHRFEV